MNLRENTIYLEFLKVYGFNPNGNTLELSSDVATSLSQSLERAYLLSEKAYYSDLMDSSISGAKGSLTATGIEVPKSLEADEYFRMVNPKIKSLLPFHYILPEMCDFDSIISKEPSRDLVYVPNFLSLHSFIGTYKKSSDKEQIKYLMDLYEALVQHYKRVTNDNWQLERETVSEADLDLFLIRKRN